MALTDFHIKKNDTSEIIAMQLEYADGSLINGDLTGASVYFSMMTNAGTVLVDNATAVILDAAQKTVGYEWAGSDTATVSPVATPHLAEFKVVFADGAQETFPNSPEDGGSDRPFIRVHVWERVA